MPYAAARVAPSIRWRPPSVVYDPVAGGLALLVFLDHAIDMEERFGPTHQGGGGAAWRVHWAGGIQWLTPTIWQLLLAIAQGHGIVMAEFPTDIEVIELTGRSWSHAQQALAAARNAGGEAWFWPPRDGWI